MIRLTLLFVLVVVPCGCSGTTAASASASSINAEAKAKPATPAAQPATAADNQQKLDVGARASRLLRKFRNAADPEILVVAHRGDWHSAPENSLAAIESCIEMGADMIEIDVRTTGDGMFVLMHDKTLERTTTGSGKVSNYTLAEVKKLQLKDHTGKVTDQHPPSLEEALELARGRILVYLDKTDLVIPAVYKLVERLKLGEQSFFYGQRPYGEVEHDCGAILGQINYLPKIGDETPHLAEYVEQYHQQLKPAAFVISFANQSSPVLDQCPLIREKHTRIWASPLGPEMAAGRTDEAALTDPEGNWGWLINQGATILCTDRPRELLAYLRKSGRHE